MKLLTFLIGSCVVIMALVAAEDDDSDISVVNFNNFKKRYRKKYIKGAQCSYFRLWKNRKRMVIAHNQASLLGQSSFRMVDNQFADESDDEWKTKLLGLVLPDGEFKMKQIGLRELIAIDQRQGVGQRPILSSTKTIPSSFDLRKHVCMPPVKSQSSCGACWAFIATMPIEFQTCLINGKTATVLSEQQLVDCSSPYGNYGCGGGFYTYAWNYLLAVGGQTANATYPYTAVVGNCQFKPGVTRVSGTLERYVYLDSNEKTILYALLQRGPIAVSIVANSKFILYSSGIFDDETCKTGTINHGVMLVGYGTANNTNYWIVRNSWGARWGQNGYILMKRDVNMCRLAEYAFLPLV